MMMMMATGDPAGRLSFANACRYAHSALKPFISGSTLGTRTFKAIL